jgi:low affinity Fe/Cu permease
VKQRHLQQLTDGDGGIANLDALDHTLHGRSTRFVTTISRALGSFPVIILSALLVVAWGLTAPLIQYSDTWQRIISTGITVITFSMVVIIQNTQNRDSRAIQTKLDAIMRALDGVDDDLIGLEERPERAILHAQTGVRDRTPDENDASDANDADDVGNLAPTARAR